MVIWQNNTVPDKMNENRKYTAFCGLYCKDCIPSKTELYELTGKLADLLEKLGFEHYAQFKSKRVKEFENYPMFRKLLAEIQKIQCKSTCFEGPASEYGCNPDCKIRECIMTKNLDGCWECAEYKICEKLEWHKKFHPGMEHNLELIKKHGIENWLDKKGKHYPWDK
ncbi:MAG: DUF3795 domain-containing protein [Bacteroidales bacterium]|nr:DUF3795 domain-containing protein [Bacteroidales bacterium]